MSRDFSRAGGHRPVPVETVEHYEISTAEICEWLQKRLNNIITVARDNGETIDDIPINVVTVEFSKKFAPMIIVLPDSAIATKNRNGKDGIMRIFQSEENNDYLKLEKPVWAAISPYMFTPNDRKSFMNSASMRKTLELTTSDANKIASMCSPKIFAPDGPGRKGSNRDDKHVIFLIDPLRIFSEYVGKEDGSDRNRDNTPRYMIHNSRFHKLSDDNYMYEIEKRPKKSSKRTNVSGVDVRKILRESIYRKN